MNLHVDLINPLEDQLKELGIVTYLDLSRVVDVYPASEDITDIEDGRDMLNISPTNAIISFKKRGRRGLTVREGLALYRADKSILKHHNLDLVGSQYGSEIAPHLCLDDGEPELGAAWGGLAAPGWGAPSCGSVLSLETGNLGSLESRILDLEHWRDGLIEVWKKQIKEMEK